MSYDGTNGLYLASSDNASIFGNTFSHSTAIDKYSSGITILSPYCKILENTFEENAIGVTMSGFSNVIYHNNFIHNGIQVSSTYSLNNKWDDGYPSGGNYWSDYHSADIYRGQHQNLTGSDGIGDVPYPNSYSNDIDHYPLMNPFGSPSSLTYNLTIIAATGGRTNPTFGTYAFVNGSLFTIAAIPDPNYTFDHWELDSTNIGSANPTIVQMIADHTLEAVYTYIPPPPLYANILPASATFNVVQSRLFTSIVSGGTTPYSYQ